MRKQSLELYKFNNRLRAVIKNKHGRLVYLELELNADCCEIHCCYYVDRSGNNRHCTVPNKWLTKQCKYVNLLDVIANELNRQYYGIEISELYSELGRDEFISQRLSDYRRGYNFLICVGEGDSFEGIPVVLKTRFKNRIHRSIYMELRYYGNGKSAVVDCHYYDRKYKSRELVIPENLSSVLFEYNRAEIIRIINSELNNDFTDIIFITDGSIDITDNIPLCGNI